MPMDHDQLVAAIKQAKSKPMFFGFVAKGTDGSLLLDKKKIAPKDLADAKKALGGGTIFKGRCHFEEGVMVFEVPKEPPPTLVGLIKKTIKRDAALTLEIVVRFNAELAESEEGETAGEDSPQAPIPTAPPGPPPTATAPPPPPPPPHPDPRVAEVMHRLNAMSPGIKAALAGPDKARVQALFVAVNGSIKSQDHVQASLHLDALEPLLAQLSAPAAALVPPPAPPPPPAPVAPAGADVIKRLNAMSAAIKTALAGPNKAAVQALFMAVNGAIKSKDFDQARHQLDELAYLLDSAATPAPEAAPTGEISLVRLGKARLEWNTLRLQCVDGIKRLKSILQDQYAGDTEEEGTLASALQRLDGTMETMNEDLGDQLDAVLNADLAGRIRLIPDARKAAENFAAFIQSDEIMSSLDGNEYDPDMEVAGPMRAQLLEIVACLP